MRRHRVRHAMALMTLICAAPGRALAQTPEPAANQVQEAAHEMDMLPTGWHFEQDGQLLLLLNHQGGPRGADEFKAPNWWMGMATRRTGRSRLTLDAMLSLDPATVGTLGYSELFQVGEAIDNRPIVDRQHPHDFFMQLSGAWRVPVTSETSVTLAGGPVGEPALGPIAFMHRPSAAENPLAPLSHHTFDSTHVAFGVMTVAVDHGPWTIEGSIFNGREPDQHRWNFDFGPLDSASARIWLRPGPRWELQASTGHLTNPEALHPGNIERTTASVAWLAREGAGMTAVTAGYGVNKAEDETRQAVFAEATRRLGRQAWFARAEVVDVETGALLGGAAAGASGNRIDTVGAFSVGASRDLVSWHGFEGALGGMVTTYAVPEVLQGTHGSHPVSLQLFFRLRPPAGSMGRMWNMRMAEPMPGSHMRMD
jgi:hypothetical protein